MSTPEAQLAALQGQMATMSAALTTMQLDGTEMKRQLHNAREENRILNNTMAAGLGTLPELVTAIKSQSSKPERVSLIDQRGLGKPAMFTENEEKFTAWMRKIENYVVGVFGEEFRQVMIWAAESDAPVDQGAWQQAFGPQSPDAVIDGIDDKVNKVYTVLVSLTEDETTTSSLVRAKGTD